jgi:hypothetical protein
MFNEPKKGGARYKLKVKYSLDGRKFQTGIILKNCND